MIFNLFTSCKNFTQISYTIAPHESLSRESLSPADCPTKQLYGCSTSAKRCSFIIRAPLGVCAKSVGSIILPQECVTNAVQANTDGDKVTTGQLIAIMLALGEVITKEEAHAMMKQLSEQ